MISRRQIILGTTVAALAACSSQSKSISILYFAGLAEGKRLKAQADAYTRKTGIRVIFKEVRYDDVRPTELLSLTASKPVYDIVYVDDVWMYEFVKKKILKDLTPFVRRDHYDYDDFIPKVVDAEGELDGNIWLIPHRADVQLLFYNKGIFDNESVRTSFKTRMKQDLVPPQTWGEYRTVARGLSGLSFDNRKLIGSAETFKRPHFAFEFFATRYWSLTGTEFLDEFGTPLFDSDAGATALEYVGSLKESWAPGSLNAAHDETISAFAGGTVALCPQWYGFYAKLHDETGLGDRLGVVPMPGVAIDGVIRRAPSIGGGSLGIAANSESFEVAWDFLKFATSREVMAAGAEAGEIVTRRSAYASPKVAERNPAVGVYLQSLNSAKFRPRSPNYAAMEQAIGEGVSRFLAGEADARTALKDAANKVADVTTQAN